MVYPPPSQSEAHAQHFTNRYERRVVAGAGHNFPQESPDSVVRAVCDLLGG